MLSIKPVKNNEQAKQYYFEQDNYYLQDTEELKESTQWWGNGAERLGLTGYVESETFLQLLEGRLTNGQHISQSAESKTSHRPGFDLTFSAPKSVSILAEMGKDYRLRAAHDKAVRETMAYVEKHFAQARITKNYETRYVDTGNLVVALFRQDTSRLLDPHLHTHCVVMNMTERSEGVWRALASQMSNGKNTETNGFYEQVMQQQRMIGAIYRSALAYEVKQLGYEIRLTIPEQARFEIVGIPENVLHNFSKRRQDIETHLEQHGFSGARAASIAALATREAKKSIARETLHQQWKEQADELNFDAASVIHRSYEQPTNEHNRQESELSAIALKALHYAMQHLSERDTILSRPALINATLTYATGDITLRDVFAALDHAALSKELIPLTGKHPDDYYTTQTLLKYETETLQCLACQRYQVTPLLAGHKPIHEKGIMLTDEQQTAVRKILGSYDRISALTGHSGSGKTALLPTLVETLKQQGSNTQILTPSQAAGKAIQRETGLTVQTLSRFLSQTERAAKSRVPSVVIVDNAHMMGYRQLHQLVHSIEKNQQYLILLGDTRSYLPIEGSNPLAQMESAGLHTAHLTTLHRQSHTQTREAIKDTLRGDITAAFEKLENRIHVIPNTDERLQAMAKQYCNSPSDKRDETLALVSSQKERNTVNHAIREGLKQKSELEATGTTFTVLVPKRLTSVQAASVISYQAGDIVLFHQDSQKLGIKSKTYCSVIATDPDKHQLMLKTPRGKTIVWDMAQVSQTGIAVFKTKELEVCVGDQLRTSHQHASVGFLKPDSLFSGEKITVSQVKDHTLHVIRENGPTMKLDMRKMAHCHLDYGYAVTPYATYHEQPKHLIAHHASYSPSMHLRSFYKQLSQAKETAWLYTDQKESYEIAVKTQSGDRTTAIDAFIKNAHSHLKKQHDISAMVAKEINEVIFTSTEVPVPPSPDVLARKTVDFAIRHLSERETTFTLEALFTTAMQTQAFGNTTLKHIQEAVTESLSNGQLQAGQEKNRWTTPEAITIEKNIIELAREGVGKRVPIATEEMLKKALDSHTLNASQQKAVSEITLSKDAVQLVQGFPGVGKTTMLACVKTVCDSAGSQLLGLAPSHTAVRELRERGIPSQTLQSFLGECQQHELRNTLPDYSRTLLIVDEASMTSNRMLFDLLRYMKMTGATIVPVGDRYQLASPDAGKPFTILQRALSHITVMDKILRQETPELRAAIDKTIKKEFSAAFEHLREQVSEGKQHLGIIELKIPTTKEQNHDEMEETASQHYLEPLAKHFMSLTPEEREQTLLITPRNKDRNTVNALIRDALKQEGFISNIKGDDQSVSILVPENRTVSACGRADQYKQGEYIRFNCTLKTLGIKKGSYWRVTDVNIPHKTVLLQNHQGEKVAWQPHRYAGQRQGAVEVYSAEKRELCVGDHIRWTRSDKTQGQFAADTAKVIWIQDNNVTVKLQDNTLKTCDMTERQNQHFDYAYASTTFTSQGKTTKYVITYEDSRLTHLTNQSGFFVAISRAKWGVTIYTDNQAKLLERINKNTGEKTSALEFIEYSFSKPSEKATLSNLDPISHRKNFERGL